MRVRVISDIHGNFEDLERVADEGIPLLILGDLLDYIDYFDPSRGVLGTIFGPERVTHMIRLRTKGEFEAYHAYDRALWATLNDPSSTLDEIVRTEYQRICDLLGPDTFVTLGNVDVRETWDDIAPAYLRCLDGVTRELGGRTLGFVGGGAVRHIPEGSPWKSFDRHPDVFIEQLEGVGCVEVLCTHVPPRITDLRHDTVSMRNEMYGPGITEYVDQYHPKLSLFGHIHHPRVSTLVRGTTTFRNVGYFKRDPAGVLVDLESLTIILE